MSPYIKLRYSPSAVPPFCRSALICAMLYALCPMLSAQDIVPHRDIQKVDSLNRGKPATAPVTVIKQGYAIISKADGRWYEQHLGRYIQDTLGIGGVTFDSITYDIITDSLCFYSPSGSYCTYLPISGASADHDWYGYDTGVAPTITEDSIRTAGAINYILIDSARLETYGPNYNNWFWHTQLSRKNTTGDGYMGHNRISFDSLAFPALADPYGRFGDWIFSTSWDSTINAGFENGGNMIHKMGINYDQGSPTYNPLRPKFTVIDIEQGYYPGAGNSMWLESHQEFTDTLGRTYRPYSYAMAYDGSFAAVAWTSDLTTMFQAPDQVVGAGKWEEWDYPAGTHDIWYDYRGRINSKYTGTVVEKYSNAIVTPTYRNILTHDADDDLWVGDSTGIDITNKLRFRINSFTTPLIKSNNYTLQFDTVLVNFLGQNAVYRNFTLSSPGVADKMLYGYDGNTMFIGKFNSNETIFKIHDDAPNHSLGIASNGKLRINMNAGYGGVDFVQFADDLSGGWMTRDAAQAYYVGEYIDGSNDWVINHNGTERFKLKSSGLLNIAAMDATPPSGAVFGLLGHATNGDVLAVTPGPSLEIVDGVLDVSGGGSSDIYFTDSTICFIALPDTLCILIDSTYSVGDSLLCYIYLGDTTCVGYSTSGGNVYTINGALTANRTVDMNGKTFKFDFGPLSGEIRLAQLGLYPLMTIDGQNINNNTSSLLQLVHSGTGDMFMNFNGLAAAEDYAFGVDKSADALVIAEGTDVDGAGDQMMLFYAAGDSIVSKEDHQFDAHLLDEDGQAPTPGDVLTGTATGVNWAAPSTGGGAISALTAATATNDIDNLAYQQDWRWNSLAGGSGLKLSSNSTLAASNTQRLFHVDLSGANATASQTTYGGYFSNTHTGSTSTNYGLYATATGGTQYNIGLSGEVTSGIGVYGIATTGTGVWGQSSSLFGGYFQSTSNYGVYGYSTSNHGVFGYSETAPAIVAYRNAATNNDVLTSLQLQRVGTGAGANGIGTSIEFTSETSTTPSPVANTLTSKWTDATHASRTSQFIISGVNSATTQDLATLDGSGQLTLNQYTTSNFNGGTASDSVLVVTAAGVVKKRNASAFGGSGGDHGALTGLSDDDHPQYVNHTGAESIDGVKTFTSDPLIPDEAYDATAWNGSLEPPTKNAVRDKIETLSSGGITFQQVLAITSLRL